MKETFLAVARDPKPDPPKSEEKKKKTGKDAKAVAGKGKKETAAKKGKTGVAKGKKNNSAANSNAKKASGKGKSKYVVGQTSKKERLKKCTRKYKKKH